MHRHRHLLIDLGLSKPSHLLSTSKSILAKFVGEDELVRSLISYMWLIPQATTAMQTICLSIKTLHAIKATN